ncbi:hypothetical protein SFUMM280S_02598 [Streptomyces fumanus]
MFRDELRAGIGMVLQDTWLFGGTIAENIAYGAAREVTRGEIEEAARAAHADRFVRTLPDGYDTVIDDEGTGVSAGEKQLITIARAFLSDPVILVLDEATSSVDTRTEVLIQKAMAKLAHGRTSFVIAHRLSTIRDADTILVMENGSIVEQGTHTGLLAAGGAYGAARVHDGLAYGGVGRGGELVDAVRVEGRGDQLGALEGELEQLALGGVDGVAQVQGRAARGLGRGGGVLLGAGPALVGGGGAAAAAVAGPAGELRDPLDDELGVEDAQHPGELHGDLVLGAAVLDPGDHRGRLVQGGGAAPRGVQVVAGDDLAQRELEERGARLDQVGDGLVALGQPQVGGPCRRGRWQCTSRRRTSGRPRRRAGPPSARRRRRRR